MSKAEALRKAEKMEEPFDDCPIDNFSIAVDYTLSTDLDVVDSLSALKAPSPLFELLTAALFVDIKFFLRRSL